MAMDRKGVKFEPPSKSQNEAFVEKDQELLSLEEFAQGTSLHGLKNTLSKESAGPRLAWRILFLLLIVVCISLLAVTIHR